MPSPNNSGFTVHLIRQRVERRTGNRARTVGDYQCYWQGAALDGLSGQMLEPGGPGDNTDAIGDAKDRRIVARTYPLAIHWTSKYRTFGYTNSEAPQAKPRPAVRLESTDERDGILIHPSSGYLWSIGCLIPCTGIEDAWSNVDYPDSRRRVIAIIDGLVNCLGSRMPREPHALIPDSRIIVEGEP